jgi:hypothetical protein
LEILDAAQASCPGRGELCLLAGAPTTRAVVAEHGSSSSAWDGPARFTRTAARPGPKSYSDEGMPWTVDVTATLRQRALAGNTLFIVYDAEDHKAMAGHEVTALWQAPIRAGTTVAARLVLSPDDGFQAPHTYHIRVVQIIHGRQVVLASGDIRLQ